MKRTNSLWADVLSELQSFFVPPRTFLIAIIINGIVSFGFFLASYYLGNYNPNFLPFAAATILLWTLADASLTNQLLFDKPAALAELNQKGTLERLLLVKNLAVVIVSIPLTVIFGLFLVVILGKWSEILLGVALSLTLIWGWLGISNALSIFLPFRPIDLKTYLKNREIWLVVGLLYALPWVLLPVYALMVGLPFLFLGWLRADSVSEHKVAAVLLLLAISSLIWLLSLRVANRYIKHPDSRIKKLITE